MAYKAINNIAAVDLDDINKESATKKYPLGTKIEVNDTSKGQASVFVYVKAHAALNLGQPVNLIEGTGGDAELVTAAFAAIATGAGELIGYPTTAVTSGYYFWAQVSGVITAAAGTVAAGDYVRVIESGTTVTVDGTTGSTSRKSTSCGLAKTATSGGLATIVVMPGLRSHIAESTPPA